MDLLVILDFKDPLDPPESPVTRVKVVTLDEMELTVSLVLRVWTGVTALKGIKVILARTDRLVSRDRKELADCLVRMVNLADLV